MEQVSSCAPTRGTGSPGRTAPGSTGGAGPRGSGRGGEEKMEREGFLFIYLFAT